MKVFKKISDIQAFLSGQKQAGRRVGFVPTMGALHRGHTTLVADCKAACDVAVVSIFVNPTQFNDPKDLVRYPRTIDRDLQALINAGCDILFFPEVAEIYPPSEITRFYELGTLEKVFEGAYRPGHFQGVCQVVDKLFAIVRPDQVFFGQKDYQQCMVIKKLLQMTPGHQAIEMTIAPTIREANGLAMSSRNMRLTPEEQVKAGAIYQTLQSIKEGLRPGDIATLIEASRNALERKGFIVDYVSVANAQTLTPINKWDGEKPLVALVAASLSGVRLIDNMIIA
ncbi:pantoate--beta-alanine ligase [Niabella insulamsoli]|uniref:pantoate--beta-alanine ligase n=1 Tax=Niabella insulamsoli TaxID=3144874 RepID=UPI0031FE39B9